MYIDFSSAFDTVGHDKLLLIMRSLGFPEDCIEAVKDLYTDAENWVYGASWKYKSDQKW